MDVDTGCTVLVRPHTALLMKDPTMSCSWRHRPRVGFVFGESEDTFYTTSPARRGLDALSTGKNDANSFCQPKFFFLGPRQKGGERGLIEFSNPCSICFSDQFRPPPRVLCAFAAFGAVPQTGWSLTVLGFMHISWISLH